MRGLIYREPADLLETGERSKGNKLGIKCVNEMFGIFKCYCTCTNFTFDDDKM